MGICLEDLRKENDVLDTQNQPTGEKYYTLPHTAYSYPEAGCGEGYLGHQHTDNTGRNCDIPGWTVAEEGKDYAEFEVYFKAVQTDDGVVGGYKQVAREVYMSDYIFKSVANDKYAHEALRVYLEINDGKDGTFLFANKEYKDANDPQGNYSAALDGRLNLYGPLNLDRSNETEANPNASEYDRYYSTLWNDNLAAYGNHPTDVERLYDDDNDPATPDVDLAGQPYLNGEEIVYGNYGDKQATQNIANMKQERDAEGKMPVAGEKKLFTTSETDAVKVRVVIWLEGWEPMKVDNTNYKLEWNPEYSAETSVQVGLQFDTGIFRGEDLTAPAAQQQQP